MNPSEDGPAVVPEADVDPLRRAQIRFTLAKIAALKASQKARSANLLGPLLALDEARAWAEAGRYADEVAAAFRAIGEEADRQPPSTAIDTKLDAE